MNYVFLYILGISMLVAPLLDDGDVSKLWEARKLNHQVPEDVEWPLEEDLWSYCFLKWVLRS